MSAPMSVVTESFLTPEPWMRDAACTDVDPDMFFPNRGDHYTAKKAREVCAGCPVAGDCLDYAMRTEQMLGVWGGLTERERRKLRSGLPNLCRDCGASIGDRAPSARLCRPCAAARRTETKKTYEQKGAA